MNKIASILIFSWFCLFSSFGQSTSSLRIKKIPLCSDSIIFDTLSISPNDIYLNLNQKDFIEKEITIDYVKSLIIINNKSLKCSDTLFISYRVLPLNLNSTSFHKNPNLILADRTGMYKPFTLATLDNENNSFKNESFSKTGSISRGISFGNNQNVVVNSNLNLQLSGKLTEDIEILAAITDNNIPFQPQGNTQQLQEFDKVYIQLSKDNQKLTAGDFQLSRPNSYFLNYYKRAQGGMLSTQFIVDSNKRKSKTITTTVAAAISKGKFARNVIQGIEGNQGPYRLTGSENETFIIVMSGTEKIYIDGQLLTRGQENDYVIDYNTSEVTFTAKRFITKDRRIVAEFQYADKNYARSLFVINNTLVWKKNSLDVNYYNEQDNKNRPLQLSLNDPEKTILANAGDNLLNALTPGVDSVSFRNDIVLYAKRDVIVGDIIYKNVYVHSNNKDSAFFQLSFSNVGQSKGNYIQIGSTSNGRVFKWMTPINGILQGNFEPVILLITPKKRQMLSAVSKHIINKNNSIKTEFAVSNFDKNTFSELDANDDNDIAIKFNSEHIIPFAKRDSVWNGRLATNYEQVNKNFNYIERFRSVEFERDWNIKNYIPSQNQHLIGIEAGLIHPKKGFVTFQANQLIENQNIDGKQIRLLTNIQERGFSINHTSSATKVKLNDELSTFYRQRGSISQNINKIKLGLKSDAEQNKMLSRNNDTLKKSSFQFLEWQLYVTNSDSTANRATLTYSERTDWLSQLKSLEKSTFARSLGFNYDLISVKNSILKTTSTYRKLNVLDSTLSSQKADNSLSNRIEYNLRILNGFVSYAMFYEAASGLELKKEYVYIAVAAGQGIYAWKDYNENGIKEINEFEISAFPDQAIYIKVYTPTNSYLKTYNNQFSQAININPAILFSNPIGIKKFISLWSNQFSYRADRKTISNNLNEAYNPFYTNINDSSLQSIASNFRNTLFFNKTAYLFGADYSFQDLNSKTLLVNGFDGRTNKFHTIRFRLAITKFVTINNEGNFGSKSNTSQFLQTRNFTIYYMDTEPKFVWQPSPNFRCILSYKYSDKRNASIGESFVALQNKPGMEFKYNITGKGSWTTKINLIDIKFTGTANSPIGYEMLEGLSNGRNYTWNVSYQQNVGSNLQVSLSYDGRKSINGKAVHTGGVNVRAIF